MKCSITGHSIHLGARARCPVHNQALVGTIDYVVVSISSRQGGMVRLYPTTAGLTTFNQPLADQDLSGFFLIVHPSEIEGNSMTLSPLQTGSFRAL